MKKSKRKNLFNPVLKDKKIIIEKSPAPSPIDAHVQNDEVSEEDRMFLDAVSDVKPLEDRKKKTSCTHIPSHPAHPAPDEAQETLEYLRGLVSGTEYMDITFTDEYMEGCVTGVGRKVIRRLKRGQIPVQDHLDLHGLTKQEAEKQVRDFLLQSQKIGLRCVLIIHGRGLNSPSSFPVLKDSIPAWFTRGPARKAVLAFATAKPYDGGAGAVYVLLRSR
jgi:DNA-nicking Smr family endonuclease